MANVFKNYTTTGVGTTEATVYTVPASTTSVLLGCNLANVSASAVTLTVKLGATTIVKDAPVPAGSALGILDGKIIAESADTIKVTSSAASSVDVVLSVMEQS